jgi:hypothetical protein
MPPKPQKHANGPNICSVVPLSLCERLEVITSGRDFERTRENRKNVAGLLAGEIQQLLNLVC